MIWNNELEQSVLSCLLIDPGCLEEVEAISIQDFADPQNQAIFKAILKLVGTRKNVDYLTVHEESKKKITLNYLMQISRLLPTTLNFKTYVAQLKELTKRRKLFYLADEIKNAAYEGEEDALEKAEKGIFELREWENNSDNVAHVVTEVMEQIEERLNNPGLMGLTSGFRDIDKFTDGFRETDYIILAGRPSMGKSSLAFNIAQRCGGNVDIYTLETSQQAVYKRMILAEANISALKIRGSHLTAEQKREILDKLWETARKYYDGRVRVLDGRKSIAEVKSCSRKRKIKEGLDLIIIDYLQLVKSQGKDRYEAVTNTSMDIREMIMELRVPVLALAQLNREAGAKKIPELRELKESGQIEQDADVICLLHRNDYYDITQNKKPANEGEVDLIFAKQRDNPIGTIKLGFIKNCTKFVDIKQMILSENAEIPADAPWK